MLNECQLILILVLAPYYFVPLWSLGLDLDSADDFDEESEFFLLPKF